MHIHTVGIWCNCEKPGAVEVAGQLLNALCARGIKVCAERKLMETLGDNRLESGYDDCDVIAVLGGDGTILSCMEVALPRDIPLWGVNLGRLGFLSETEPGKIVQDVQLLTEGKYQVEERMLLSATLPDGGRYLALNEVGILRSSPTSRTPSLEIRMAGKLVYRFRGDGAVVATPTGSTAYAFAAGGPVVFPDVRLMLLCPVCPHTANTRPAVLPADQALTIGASEAGEALLAMDGKRVHLLGEGECVRVEAAEERLRFIRLHDRDFFSLLRGKLMDVSG